MVEDPGVHASPVCAFTCHSYGQPCMLAAWGSAAGVPSICEAGAALVLFHEAINAELAVDICCWGLSSPGMPIHGEDCGSPTSTPGSMTPLMLFLSKPPACQPCMLAATQSAAQLAPFHEVRTALLFHGAAMNATLRCQCFAPLEAWHCNLPIPSIY